jgi:hypothetical protein
LPSLARMTTKILILATILCVSAVAHATDSKPIKADKDNDKDKDKDTVVVSVPDGDPSTGLLLTVVAGTAVVWNLALARRRKNESSGRSGF